MDFSDILLGRLDRCSVLLAVIGRHWLTATDEHGARRIDTPDDWVRREIAAALARGLRVVPVLVDDAELPGPADLPEDIAALHRRQYVRLRHRHTGHDLAQLVEAVGSGDAGLAESARRQQLAGAAAAALVRLLASTGWEQAQQVVRELWRAHPDVVHLVRADLADARAAVLAARRAADEVAERELTEGWRRRLRRLLASEPEVAVALRELIERDLPAAVDRGTEPVTPVRPVTWLPAADPDADPGPAPTVVMRAAATGNGRVLQAARDQHISGL